MPLIVNCPDESVMELCDTPLTNTTAFLNTPPFRLSTTTPCRVAVCARAGADDAASKVGQMIRTSPLWKFGINKYYGAIQNPADVALSRVSSFNQHWRSQMSPSQYDAIVIGA